MAGIDPILVGCIVLCSAILLRSEYCRTTPKILYARWMSRPAQTPTRRAPAASPCFSACLSVAVALSPLRWLPSPPSSMRSRSAWRRRSCALPAIMPSARPSCRTSRLIWSILRPGSSQSCGAYCSQRRGRCGALWLCLEVDWVLICISNDLIHRATRRSPSCACALCGWWACAAVLCQPPFGAMRLRCSRTISSPTTLWSASPPYLASQTWQPWLWRRMR